MAGIRSGEVLSGLSELRRKWSRRLRSLGSRAGGGGAKAAGGRAAAMELDPDAVWLVSYPRSGNTWLRFLLTNLLAPETPATFASMREAIPSVYRRGARTGPRDERLAVTLYKSHQPYTPSYRRVVLIVRDPRAVAVSYYHYQLTEGQRSADETLDAYLDRFLAGRVSAFGSWGDSVGGWLAARGGDAGMHVVRYEDLMADTAVELARMAVFAGIPHTPESVEAAVVRSSADELRRVEKAFREKAGQGDVPLHTRRAGVDGWRKELTSAQAARIEAAWPELMRRFGYLPGGGGPSA